MPEHDIVLIGTGISMPEHLTPEARAALGGCRVVHHLTAYHDLLCELCPGEVVDWQEAYLAADGARVYDDMAEAILAEAARGPGVGFAVYGHPLVLVDTCNMVIAGGIRQGLSVRVVSGISSIDVLLEYLLLDAGLAGLQVHEVNRMVAGDKVPDPEMACFIMQVGAFDQAGLRRDRPVAADHYAGLKRFLLRRYRPAHPAVLLAAPFRADMPLIRRDARVEDLDRIGEAIHTGMSMYLPPAVPGAAAAAERGEHVEDGRADAGRG